MVTSLKPQMQKMQKMQMVAASLFRQASSAASTMEESRADFRGFSREVPSELLELNRLTEKLWTVTIDRAWAPGDFSDDTSDAADEIAKGHDGSDAGGEHVISRDEFLVMRSNSGTPTSNLPTLARISATTSLTSHTRNAKLASMTTENVAGDGHLTTKTRTELQRSRQPQSSNRSSSHSSLGSLAFKQALTAMPLPRQETEAEESDSEDEDDSLDDCDIIVGPTQHAFNPLTSDMLTLKDTDGKQVPIKSSPGRIYLSDVRRLSHKSETAEKSIPVSFGSALHLCGHVDKCRPCLFERAAGRCRKLWLCDFCHMHAGRRRKVKSEAAIQREEPKQQRIREQQRRSNDGAIKDLIGWIQESRGI